MIGSGFPENTSKSLISSQLNLAYLDSNSEIKLLNESNTLGQIDSDRLCKNTHFGSLTRFLTVGHSLLEQAPNSKELILSTSSLYVNLSKFSVYNFERSIKPVFDLEFMNGGIFN